jgi:hypothetical protein
MSIGMMPRFRVVLLLILLRTRTVSGGHHDPHGSDQDVEE